MNVRWPFRQIHLDFHNSEAIPSIGHAFDAAAYVHELQAAHVDSVVTFAKCHHGWSYYDTEVGARHPGLSFDLLRGQFDACKAAGIQVPLYVSVGWDERAARMHPEWRQIQPDGTFRTLGALGRNLQATWSYLCLGTPYLDVLCAQIEELATRFPAADGFWLDITSQAACCCSYCRSGMDQNDLDWTREADRDIWRRRVELHYLGRTNAAARHVRADMPVFHNMGHVRRGDREFLSHLSHADVESLPTGGWGYDHGPLTARYLDPLGLSQAGLTGRFHTVWGEFGGYKHPNALRHECAVMLAQGQRCVVGDQLEPGGRLDPAAYRLIGEAFAEVKVAQVVCDGSRPVSEIGVLSSLASRAKGELQQRDCPEDDGVVRMLLEGHHSFDVLDRDSDFSSYRLVILPDQVRPDAVLTARLRAYLEGGGALLLSAMSALPPDHGGEGLPLGATPAGTIPYEPVFVDASDTLKSPIAAAPVVFYGPAVQWKLHGAESLAAVFPPYFNRSPRHFSGHQHTAPAPQRLDAPGAFRYGRCIVFAHAVFTGYRRLGAVAHKQIVLNAVEELLDHRVLLRTTLPSTARVTLRQLNDGDRHVLHIADAAPVLRGQTLLGPLEVIEDLPTHVDASVSVAWPIPGAQAAPSTEVIRVSRVNDGEELPWTLSEGRLHLRLPRFVGSTRILIEH